MLRALKTKQQLQQQLFKSWIVCGTADHWFSVQVGAVCVYDIIEFAESEHSTNFHLQTGIRWNSSLRGGFAERSWATENKSKFIKGTLLRFHITLLDRAISNKQKLHDKRS